MKQQVIKGLSDFIKGHQGGIFPAKVESVDEANQTIKCIDLHHDVTIYGVRLNASTDIGGLRLIPKVGSTVLVEDIGESKTDFVVIAWSELEKVQTTIQTTEVEMSANGFKIVKGSDSLKMIMGDLISAIKAITVTAPNGVTSTPINSAVFDLIENRLNGLFDA